MAKTLQQLGIAIDAGQDVQEDDVKNAFQAEMEAIEKQYEEWGKKGSPEEKRYIERLKHTRERLLKRLEELNKAKREKLKADTSRLRLKLSQDIRDSLEMRRQLQKQREAAIERKSAVDSARSWAVTMTNPDREGAYVPDYENESGTDKANRTRSTLTGWLSAFKMQADSMAQKQLQLAHETYDKSDTDHDDSFWGLGRMDAVLYYEDMIKYMDMGKHFKALHDYKLDLASESQGFLAGYMAVAEKTLGKKAAQEYQKYLLSTAKQLDLSYKGKERGAMRDVKKGIHQMKSLTFLLSPKEWKERQEELVNEFQQLQYQAERVQRDLKFELKAPATVAFLAKDREKLSMNDLPLIDQVRGAIQRATSEYLAERHGELAEKNKEIEAAAEKLFKRNEEMKHFSDEDIDVIKKRMKYAEEEMEKTKVSASDSLEDMIKAGKRINSSHSYMDSLLTRIQEMDVELDAEKTRREEEKKRKEEEEKRRKEEEARRKKAAAAAAAARARGKSSAKESKEKLGGLEDFLLDKHLLEEKVKGGGYVYSLDLPAESYPGGVLQLDFKNPEVQNRFGKQLNLYLASVWRLLEEDKKEQLRSRSKPMDLRSLFAFLGTTADITKIMFEADRESSMSFGKRPSLKQLQKEYDRTFTPAWEHAAEKLRKLVGNVKPEEVQETPTGPSIEVPPELKFLGYVHLAFVEPMTQIARYGNSPEGVQLSLPFSPDLKVTARFRRAPDGQYVLSYPGGTVRYAKIEHALQEMNRGIVHQRYIDKLLRREKPYEKYEDMVGTLRENTEGSNPGEIQLEFDWDNPNPDVVARALPYGHIVYTISRENVGPYGENTRSLYADNFEDFMLQLRHVRTWAEGPEHPQRETVSNRKEFLFDAITNPYNYRAENIAMGIGRPVSFRIFEKNELVQVHLDWGGGNNPLSNQNATLNVWITNRGQLKYTINGPGVVASNLTARNFQAMIADITRRKSQRSA